jgi:tetratricopeptide (TPR) repeat protein
VSDSAAGTPVHLPLIGRDRELALLRRVLDTGAAGRGGLAVVTGEAGIGKSRLAAEVAEQARAAGFRVGWGSCWADGGAPPLWPWQDVLAAVAGRSGPRMLDERVGVADVDPERFARFRAVAELLGRQSRAAPLLLVVEDAHAADRSALLLARFVVRAAAGSRIVTLLTQRGPAPEGPAVDTLAELAGEATVVHLGGLSAEQVAELAAHRGHDLPPARAEALRRWTSGNPLFVTELLSAGWMEERRGPLPAGIRRALGHRLDALSPATRRLLTAAAVLGASARPGEVAAMAGSTVLAVEQARRYAARAGLVAEDDTRIVFEHELTRQAVLDRLSATELAGWHGRATDALAPPEEPAGNPEPEVLVRRAHHALAASASGRVATRTAVEACRDAARVLMRGFGYEAAAELLGSALRVHTDRGDGPPAPGLLVELAQATLASGRLADARPLFRRAAQVAEDAADHVALAESALGLGGVWLAEHRGSEDHQRYDALLRRALDALPSGTTLLRERLRTRLAAEEAYLGERPVAEVAAAVEGLRALDPRAHAEGLSLLHHTMLGPAYAVPRLALAEELLRTASRCGDGMLTVMGLLWRTVDLFLLGRPEADRALAELRQRGEALRVETARLVTAEIEVTALMRAGRLAEAEEAAAECLRVGTAVGDVDAPAWYGAQLLAIRWLQGRGAELLPAAAELASSPELPVQNLAYLAGLAALCAEAGRADDARAALDRIGVAGVAALPETSSLLVTLFALAQAAAALGDAALARAVYDRLAPHAALPVMGSLAVLCFGSAERSLGVAARAFGEPDLAVAHLDRAVAANRRLANQPMLAMALADLAGTLRLRDAPGDAARAGALSADAVALAGRCGLEARARHWSDGAPAPRPAPAQAAPRLGGRLSRRADMWDLATDLVRITVPHSVGMSYLARLLAHPGVDVSAERIAGREEGAGPQPVLDRTAATAYRRRIGELRADIDAADDAADLERVTRLRLELDSVLGELRRQVRPDGRSREFAGQAELARTAVQKALRRALLRIEADAPDLADALRRSIRTGTVCRYDPVDGVPARWDVITTGAAADPLQRDGAPRGLV